MQHLQYGRKVFCFDENGAALKSTIVTEKALSGEDETAFTHRLMRKYAGQRGTLEVVFKRGHPDYAIITFAKELDIVTDV